MSDIAINDKGDAMRFNGTGWEPAPVAVNEKGDKMVHDGTDWRPLAPSVAKPIGAAMAMPTGTPQIGPGPRTANMPNVPRPWAGVLGEAASNLAPSALKFGGDVVNALAHPIDTATNIGRIAAGAISKTGRPGDLVRDGDAPPSQEELDRRARVEGPLNALMQNYADRYYGMENFKNTIASDPVSVAADASTLASAGGTAPVRGAGLVGKAGRLADPVSVVGNALKYGGKAADRVATDVLGGTTGAGGRSIRDARTAGAEGGDKAVAFQENIRGGPVSDVVDRAKGALEQVREERNAAYKAGRADLSKDATVLDFAPIDRAVNKAAEVGTFKGKTVEPAAVETVDKMRKVVDDWRGSDPADYHTPIGIDALKRSLGNLRDSTAPHSPERVSADRIYNAVRGEIANQAPAYSKMMEDYAKASDKIKEAEKTFSLGEKATGDTAARKLTSATRNNISTNFGERAKLLDELAKYDPTLPYAIAGQATNSLAPRGLVGRGGLMALGGSVVANPLNVLAAPFFSPRLVGEGAYYAGKAGGMIDSTANALGINARNARAVGRGAYQGREREQP